MKILIVKTGHTETFEKTILENKVVSLGDVLRTTPLIYCIEKESCLDWLTAAEAVDLIKDVDRLNQVHTSKDIDFYEYDLIINLERLDWVFEKLATIDQEKILGFKNYQDFSLQSETLNFNYFLEKNKKSNWSEKLFLIFNKNWNNENYILSCSKIDDHNFKKVIGLNWQVGSKWPTKIWKKSNWLELEKQLSALELQVSWQQGFDNMAEYINWINSVDLLITHDSLGLHIAMALNKKIIVLFGPTSSFEIPLNKDQTKIILPRRLEHFTCLPCYQAVCHNTIHCMENVDVDQVIYATKTIMENYDQATIRWQ